jgi:hypothetical protein
MQRSSSRVWACSALILGAVLSQAHAFEIEIGDFRAISKNGVSFGAGIRMQDPATDLLGKLNVPGQQDLCVDNCLSLSGDPAPNQRLIDAPGAFSGVNQDDGNINYRKYDLVSAPFKLTSDWSGSYGDWIGRFRVLGFYDPVNNDFRERNNDTRFQPARVDRPRKVEQVNALDVELFEAFIAREFTLGERFVSVAVGNQYLRWGESTLVAINSINEVSPPNQAFLRFPGVEFNEIFLPVPLVTVGFDVVPNVTAEVFYQLQWKAAQPDARGQFFSDLDLIEGDFAAISLGQFGEDPNQEFRFAGAIGQVSSSSATTLLQPENHPSDSGQFGGKLSYYAEWLNGGTELNAYAMNYHSRLPVAQVRATDASCLRQETNGRGDSANLVEALVDCQGFNGALLGRQDQNNPEREPLPVDTLQASLFYPEDIQLYGVSFNTNVGLWSLAGEYVYRPNLPLLVQLTDVIFMGLQPAFPANRVEPAPVLGDVLNVLQPLAPDLGAVDLGALAELGASTFPASAEAIPSFLQAYRGIDRVAPNSVINGWEDMKVHQLGFTGIRGLSSNPFGADQLLIIAEIGGTYVQGMPSRDVLQFESGFINRTHASPGADCSGSPNTAVEDCTLRLNPTQQTRGFATPFSWGLRTIIRGEYNNRLFGLNYFPQLIAGWDVNGIAPFPSQNFVEGRKEAILSTNVVIGQNLTVRLQYQWFWGAGQLNNRRDRDNAAFNVTYNF